MLFGQMHNDWLDRIRQPTIQPTKKPADLLANEQAKCLQTIVTTEPRKKP